MARFYKSRVNYTEITDRAEVSEIHSNLILRWRKFAPEVGYSGSLACRIPVIEKLDIRVIRIHGRQDAFLTAVRACELSTALSVGAQVGSHPENVEIKAPLA